MTLTGLQIGILMVVVLAANRLLGLGLDYFFKKATREDLVTKSECDARHRDAKGCVTKDTHEQCAKQGDEAVSKLVDEMRVIREILLAVAVKAGVPIENLKDLVK